MTIYRSLQLKLLRINQFSQNLFGIDFRRLLKIVYLPKFCQSLFLFKKLGGKIDAIQPIVSQYKGTLAGVASGGYFYQDLVVANHIYKNNPNRHITVGAQIDTFVAHVASFREIEVMDIRPLTNDLHPNIKFIQQDILGDVTKFNQSTDSVSCLSAIHHFGMGRYGGKIDPNGHIRGFRNLYKLLQDHGTMYIGVSLADQNRVVFNQSKHFHPLDILSWAPELDLALIKFDFVGYNGNLYQNADLYNLPEKLVWQGSNEKNGLGYFGIYTFKKCYSSS
jgi:hypothetical protein